MSLLFFSFFFSSSAAFTLKPVIPLDVSSKYLFTHFFYYSSALNNSCYYYTKKLFRFFVDFLLLFTIVVPHVLCIVLIIHHYSTCKLCLKMSHFFLCFLWRVNYYNFYDFLLSGVAKCCWRSSKEGDQKCSSAACRNLRPVANVVGIQLTKICKQSVPHHRNSQPLVYIVAPVYNVNCRPPLNPLVTAVAQHYLPRRSVYMFAKPVVIIIIIGGSSGSGSRGLYFTFFCFVVHIFRHSWPWCVLALVAYTLGHLVK